jgi:alanyl-tRNA synthetase
VTRLKVLEYLQKSRENLSQVSQILSVPSEEILSRVEKMNQDLKELKKKSKQSFEHEAAVYAKELTIPAAG